MERMFSVIGENLPQPIQMIFSKKLKIFSQFLTVFLKSTFCFKHFGNKNDSHSLCLSEITDYEIRAFVNV